MRMDVDRSLPVLPLVLDDVPPALEWMLDQEGVPWERRNPVEPRGQFLLFDSAKQRRPRPFAGQAAVDVAPLRVGRPQDPFDLYLESEAAPHVWTYGDHELREDVAVVDRRELRAELLGELRKRIEELGGLWLRKAVAPFPYRSAFGFRFDHDDYVAADFEALLAALAGNEEASSHYVLGAPFEARPEALARLKGFHVGARGQHRRLCRGPLENRENIARGLETLARAGLSPDGFAAPFGRRPAGLAAALSELGVGHSSEVTFAYDDRPFFPLGSDVLQTPVHPATMGTFLASARRRAALAKAAQAGRMIARSATESALPAVALSTTQTRRSLDLSGKYFDELIRSSYFAGEPAFLRCRLDGPLDRRAELVKQAFSTARGLAGLWRTNLAEYARWWKLREKVSLVVFRRADELVVARDRDTGPWRIGVELWRGGRMAAVALDEPVTRLRWDELAFDRRDDRGIDRRFRIDAPQPLQERFRRRMDGPDAAPGKHGVRAGWRGWAKWLLKTLHGSKGASS